jgi:regulator of sigma E protease
MLTLIYFILILGIVVFIHEFGHFIFAKKAGVYVYEFSIGMGPRIFKFNRKPKKKKVKGKTVTIVDETDYCIRLLPIGGFVQMAGEEVEVDEKIPKEKRLQSKKWHQRFMVMVAGVMNNFILAFVVLLIIGWTNTLSLNSTKLTDIDNKIYPTLQEGDRIITVDGVRIRNYDRLNLELQIHLENEFDMKVKHANGEYETVKVKPKAIKNDDGELEGLEYGFMVTGDEAKGFVAGIKYAFGKWISTVEQMFWTVWYLITGKISLKLLSGPVGIYKIVGQASQAGFTSILSLIALLNINVGFINILPLPAFDGGHALFLIIEKIKGSPVNQKVENTIHNIFFILLMALMVYVTFNDIVRFF